MKKLPISTLSTAGLIWQYQVPVIAHRMQNFQAIWGFFVTSVGDRGWR